MLGWKKMYVGGEKMDNPENKKGITIKINGEEKPLVGDDSSNSVKVAKNQASAANESEDESFDWVFPKDEGIFYQPPASTKKKNPIILAFGGKRKNPGNKSRFSFKIPFFAILFAVIVGSGLGLIVLKTITADKEVATVPVEPMEPSASIKGDSNKGAPTATAVAPLSVYLVQGGVFSNEDAAKQTQELVSAKGVPTEILKQGEKYYLFLGSATSLEESKQLAVFLKGYDVEVFWKELTLKSGSVGSSNEAIIKKMNTAYQTLTKASSAQLLNPTATTDLKSVQTDLEDLKAQVKDDSPAGLKAAYSDLNAAFDSIKQYQSTKETDHLLQAQQKLLHFLNSY